MNNEEIIKGLESVKKECGIHLDESFAWICEPIDKAIEVLSKKCHNENHDYASGNDLKRALGHPELQKERELPEVPTDAS